MSYEELENELFYRANQCKPPLKLFEMYGVRDIHARVIIRSN